MSTAIKQRTPAWYAGRRATLGSSDIPVIVGESPHKSARTLAAEKLGLIPEDIDAETRLLMDIGQLLQPSLLRMYERISGRKVRAAMGWRTHPTIAWATASLDGTAATRRVVEAKWSNAVRWRAGERVPADVQVQVQWQLFVTGWDVADVVALDHGLPRLEEIERDDQMIDDSLYFAREFQGYLERGELPPPDGSESTRRTWQQMHPRDDGSWLAPTETLAEMVRELAEARADKKTADEREGNVANALRAILGDASGITGLVSARKNADTTRTNWPAVAAARATAVETLARLLSIDWATGYVRLRLDDDERTIPRTVLPYLPGIPHDYGPGPAGLIALHPTTSEGARPLRLLKGGKA